MDWEYIVIVYMLAAIVFWCGVFVYDNFADAIVVFIQAFVKFVTIDPIHIKDNEWAYVFDTDKVLLPGTHDVRNGHPVLRMSRNVRYYKIPDDYTYDTMDGGCITINGDIVYSINDIRKWALNETRCENHIKDTFLHYAERWTLTQNSRTVLSGTDALCQDVLNKMRKHMALLHPFITVVKVMASPAINDTDDSIKERSHRTSTIYSPD